MVVQLPACAWRRSVVGRFDTLSHPAAKACCGASEAFPLGNHLWNGRTQGGVVGILWDKFFSDPTQWWDNRRSKGTPTHPDFRYKKCKEALWLSNSYKPARVQWQLAMMDTGMQRPRGYTSASLQRASGRLAAREGEWQVRTCRKLCEHGQIFEAVDALQLLVKQGCHIPNNLYYCVLKRCIAQKDLILGRRIHALSVESGYKGSAFLATHLIGMYASHRRLEEAMQVFSKVYRPDIYNWASIIMAYARHGEPTQAIGLYRQMRESTVKPDNHIFAAVLKACASAKDLAVGKDVHAHIRVSAGKPDIYVQTCLVDMYAKCGSLEDAQREFDGLSQKDVVTWTAMIAGYAQQGMGQKALGLYSRMQQEGITPPDSVTFVCLLQACANVGVIALQLAKQLHVQIEDIGLEIDMVVGASLVNMYAKCGSLGDAKRVFDRLPQKDVVTWTAMIAGYAQQGMGQRALDLYSRMQHDGITLPDSVTFVCLLQACASVAALPLGKQLHAQLEQRGLQADVLVGNSLVNMYAKCGSVEDAQQVFDLLPEKDIVAWNALIAGYTRQGDNEAVFDLVDRMGQDGIQPDGITVLSVLTVCSHVGLVDKGRKYFEAMITEYSITPTSDHYTCMMDLLGRAGHLDEALWMVRSLPFQPNGAVWHTLLGACRMWSNVEVAREAFEFAVKLDEKDAAAYALMSNIYAGAEMWEEGKEIQARRLKCGAWKEPGRSWWTDMDGVMHSFVVGDRQLGGTEGICNPSHACREAGEARICVGS